MRRAATTTAIRSKAVPMLTSFAAPVARAAGKVAADRLGSKTHRRRKLRALKRAVKNPRFTLGPVTVGRPKRDPKKTLLAMGGGALAAYLLDPTMGRTRRAKLASRTGAVARAVAQRTGRTGRRLGSTAAGLAQRAKHMRGTSGSFNDPTLQQKIQSEVLRADNVGISVDVFSGVVTLRGICQNPSDIRSIEQAVRKTEGVRDVINLLHAPGTTAPNKVGSIDTR